MDVVYAKSTKPMREPSHFRILPSLTVVNGPSESTPNVVDSGPLTPVGKSNLLKISNWPETTVLKTQSNEMKT